MKTTKIINCGWLLTLVGLVLAGAVAAAPLKVYDAARGGYIMSATVEKTSQEWQAQLSKAQYHVLREHGTEPAFSSPLHANHADGIYRCAACGLDLFRSTEKYDSGTGWPSFFAPVAKENLRLKADNSFFMQRTEVLCARCDGHLGHVFDDGPPPSGLRYCMNGVALTFVSQP